MPQDTQKVFRKPTIDDVARRANVSKSAVSHYINGRTHHCAEETGSRIRSAITELNFAPARSLLHQQVRATQTIGVCVEPPPRENDHEFYTYVHDFWSGLSSVTDIYHYRLLHYPRAVRNGAGCGAFLDGSIDGLIISPTYYDDRLEKMARAGLPTVTVARWTDLPPEVGSVWSDDSMAIDLAMEHLWKLGHRRIAHLAGGSVSPIQVGEKWAPVDAAVLRHNRYLSWLRERDANAWRLTISCPGWGALTLEAAAQALECLTRRDDPATAVLCANDAIASGILSAAPGFGIVVPRDLSVMGIDNNVTCVTMNPPLTTVALPFWSIGHEAMLLLHRMMAGEQIDDRRISVPVTHLIERASTGPV